MMTKKTKEASKARHPSSRSKTITDEEIQAAAQAVKNLVGGKSSTSQEDILDTWARYLTNDALFHHFERLLDEPKGWKGTQKRALMKEFYRRAAAMHFFYLSSIGAEDTYEQALSNRENGNIASADFLQGVSRALAEARRRIHTKEMDPEPPTYGFGA